MTTLSTYIKSLNKEQLDKFIDDVGTTKGYLDQLRFNPKKRIGPEFALALERASGYKLNAEELCPDFPWHEVADRASKTRAPCHV